MEAENDFGKFADSDNGSIGKSSEKLQILFSAFPVCAEDGGFCVVNRRSCPSAIDRQLVEPEHRRD